MTALIDLDKLAAAAEAPNGTVIAEQGWLKQILAELTEARAAAKRPVCFGLREAVGG